MLKQLKSQARRMVAKNYKSIFSLMFLYEMFSVISVWIFNFGMYKIFWHEINGLLSFLLIILLLLIKIVFIPIITVSFFRLGILFESNNKLSLSTIKSFLTRKNILNIVLINLIPNIFNLPYSFLKFFKQMFNDTIVYSIFAFALIAITFFIEYKFFICNYYFALNYKSAWETLNSSFKTMHNKLLKYIYYECSFIVWFIVFIVIGCFALIVSNKLGIDIKYIQLGVPSWFGFMLYYRPYKFLVDLLYSKRMLSDYEQNL